MSAPQRRRPIDAALAYAHRGWEVLPCHSPAKVPGGCSCHRPDCASPGKHPRVAGGLRAASTDEAVVTTWWGSWPAANVAIRTGAASGIVVVDIDPDHGGDASLQRLLSTHGNLASGRMVRTGGGGRHLYFAHPGSPIPNDVGRRLGPGLDVRGDGGYIIAPPSRHASGGWYCVAARGGEIPEMPVWLFELVRHRESKRSPAPPIPPPTRGKPSDAWARTAFEGELGRLRDARPGNRNDTLNRVAYRIGQIVGAGLLDEDRMEDVLVDAAISVGLTEREATGTVRSGINAGLRLPRGPASAWDPPTGRVPGADVEVDVLEPGFG